MEQHRQPFAIREMAMPLMETPEQQQIMELKEQLEQEKKDHQKTKSQLEDAQIKLLDRASEVEGLRNAIQCQVIRDKSAKDFEPETESNIHVIKIELEQVNKKLDDYKLENDNKFDDLKEQISKGQMQEELQKLKNLNEKLESENARLQEELSDSTTAAKGLEERIDKFEQTDVEKDRIIQELEETIRQKDCKLDGLEKELSGVKDELEKRNLQYQESKKKYEEAVMKLNSMDELQKNAMNDLELKYSQHQQQNQKQKQELEEQLQQLQQKFDKMAKDHQDPYDDSSFSEKLKECLSAQRKYLDALFNNTSRKSDYAEYSRCYYSLSENDQKKFLKVADKNHEYIEKKYGK